MSQPNDLTSEESEETLNEEDEFTEIVGTDMRESPTKSFWRRVHDAICDLRLKGDDWDD